MKTYNIKKVKLIDRLFLELEYEEVIQEAELFHTTEISMKSKREVHEDLVNAIDALIPHLSFMSEQIEDDDRFSGDMVEFSKMEEFKKFLVTGFSIGGSGDHEGVTITGRRRLRNNRVLNINTPFTKFNDENAGAESYGRLEEMILDINTCINEVCLFVDGKYKPSDQLAIEFSDKAA
jgi:hypothetical protein